MIRATTPIHIFKLPFDPEICEEILVTYVQHGKIVLEKRREDMEIDSDKQTVSYKLSQCETNRFSSRMDVEIQMRVFIGDESNGTEYGNVMASKIFTVPVERVLNDEILGGQE